MGLSSFLSKTIGSLSQGVATIFSAAAPLVTAIAPIAISAIQARAGGAFGQAVLAGGIPTGPGGAAQIAQSNFAAQTSCRVPGVAGSAPGANPITRAFISPGFDVRRIPARPLTPRFTQRIQFQQTTSFNQAAFGGSVAPTFRPFTPSFRSGQIGFSGQFQPGISRGFAPGFSFGGF